MLILRFHVFRAPIDVINAGNNFRWRRTTHFIEQQPGSLRPYGIDRSPELGAFGIKARRVEAYRCFRINRVDVNMMKVRQLCLDRRALLLRQTQTDCCEYDRQCARCFHVQNSKISHRRIQPYRVLFRSTPSATYCSLIFDRLSPVCAGSSMILLSSGVMRLS